MENIKAIEFNNVSFAYEEGTSDILSDVNFCVEYGEVTLLSGFSGSGKSTAIYLASGIIPGTIPGVISGEIKIDGKSIEGKRIGEICRKIGIVLQNADAQIIQEVVKEEIAFGCENFAFKREDIDERILWACRLMKLNSEDNTRTLSGGQKQRLTTACTLATGQKILILDEPLANLDVAGGNLLMETLKDLAKKGYAVLVVEHRLDMVLPYVDKVWSIENGRMEKVENREEYLSVNSTLISDTISRNVPDAVSNTVKTTVKSTNELPIKNGIRINNITYTHKGNERIIFDNLNLEIEEGERLLLLGENGSGKTTLMRLIGRLNRPTSGEIEQNIVSGVGDKADKNWFRSCGIVYQNPSYQLFMPTVQQEVAFGAVSEEYANEIISLFGIEDIRDRHPQSLSEGQKRRVSIAAVMAEKPQILLLDEPTVGQDHRGLKEMVEVINKIHEETGNTMITVTHDRRCAEALCDRAVIVKDGKIISIGGKELVRSFFVQPVILQGTNYIL